MPDNHIDCPWLQAILEAIFAAMCDRTGHHLSDHGMTTSADSSLAGDKALATQLSLAHALLDASSATVHPASSAQVGLLSAASHLQAGT